MRYLYYRSLVKLFLLLVLFRRLEQEDKDNKFNSITVDRIVIRRRDAEGDI